MGISAFLEELESVRRLSHDLLPRNDSVPPPVLVHCASGSGRSGVLVLSDIMRHSLEHNKVRNKADVVPKLDCSQVLVLQHSGE